jgi:AcrR family transcriptional regulator
MTERASAKPAILNAAERVVTERGAAHLTLEAVAEAAGVSKGGLLYHYPTKESLLQGMLARLLDEFAEQRASIQAQLGNDPAALLKAHLMAAFGYGSDRRQVSAAILAAGASDPALLAPVRERHQRFLAGAGGSGRRMARALVLMLATDGLWLNELLSTLSLPAVAREELLAELLRLADEAVLLD